MSLGGEEDVNLARLVGLVISGASASVFGYVWPDTEVGRSIYTCS